VDFTLTSMASPPPPPQAAAMEAAGEELHHLDGFDQWQRLVSSRHKTRGAAQDLGPRRAKCSAQQELGGQRAALAAAARGALVTFWLGRQDPGSQLTLLAGHDDVTRSICEEVLAWWKDCVTRDGTFVSKIAEVSFPAPAGRYCNMMPIRLPKIRDYIFQREETLDWMRSIPEEFKPYIPLIQACPLTAEDEGQIGYLTVDERTVTTNESQRRGGLHAESPGLLRVAPGGGGSWGAPPNPGALTFFWGGGHYSSDGERCVYEGGVYMASTVTSSCRVWNAQVAAAAMGELGDLEHVRVLLGPGTCLKKNELVWMTDTTPHESLPLAAGTPRQYFRLVTSNVTAWYADHSTPNPLGVVPPEHVTVLHGSKFANKASPPLVGAPTPEAASLAPGKSLFDQVAGLVNRCCTL